MVNVRKEALTFAYIINLERKNLHKQKRKKIGEESNTEFTSWKAMIPFKFEVRKEWSIETGHDLHEIYDYWYNPYGYI